MLGSPRCCRAGGHLERRGRSGFAALGRNALDLGRRGGWSATRAASDRLPDPSQLREGFFAGGGELGRGGAGCEGKVVLTEGKFDIEVGKAGNSSWCIMSNRLLGQVLITFPEILDEELQKKRSTGPTMMGPENVY